MAVTTLLAVDLGHVRGGWAGHIGLAIAGQSKQRLHAVGSACMAAICSRSDDGDSVELVGEVLPEPHISLTRAFYLQEHQIGGFMRALEAEMRGVSELSVGFGGLSVYTNERRDRGFASVDVAYGVDGVRQVLERVDRVMERFGKARFFADARFHASVVRLRAADGGMCMVQRAAGRLGAIDEEILRLPAARIDTVECVFGDRRFYIALDR
ncbi:poly(U)-specific 3'-to-5' RNA exonuclease [Coemansia sp. RSA 2706]|nr:poly(U)-specific 3'-to-5' RNA exonuclease [Coemansia sp. RSA 2711]KAJ2286963.1 poly(U)-specific 3'-to-5' RNA exonuclease [Coemansia sp. RSA 2706]